MTNERLDYRDKMILAPMVKIGCLPFRLLALDYGADIVYTEEIIDKRLLSSDRLENPVLGTVDYIDRRDNSLVFRCAVIGQYYYQAAFHWSGHAHERRCGS